MIYLNRWNPRPFTAGRMSNKQLEQSCVQAHLPVDYCWSLNEVNPKRINFPEG
ncbi:hypothetical protein PL8927_260008 [Planktothrix serta PCC 8927]|uniref:Uncharacterized protein n=1 Tax=Planktothrix serta PCC 8927 TaxID=671068 RepID=A0A7Z9BJS7_9CYAN|nr:hypothetical protein PL8927_260008 [Planktothrix serta PCC 8927]